MPNVRIDVSGANADKRIHICDKNNIHIDVKMYPEFMNLPVEYD